METFQQLGDLLPVLLPLIVLQLAFAGIAIYHLMKHPYPRYFGVLPWVIIILIVNLIGPILYFLIGRQEE